MIKYPDNPDSTVKLDPLLNALEKKFKNLSILIIYIKKHFLKKRDSKARIWFNIISGKKFNLSNKSIAILIEVNREAVRGLSKEPSP